MATFGMDVRDVAERLGVTMADAEGLIYEFCTLSSQAVGVEGFVHGLPDDGREALIGKLSDYLAMDLAEIEQIEARVRAIDAPLADVFAPDPPAEMDDAQKKSE